MFTGIVEEVGRIESFDGCRMRIAASHVLEGTAIGDSLGSPGATEERKGSVLPSAAFVFALPDL